LKGQDVKWSLKRRKIITSSLFQNGYTWNTVTHTEIKDERILPTPNHVIVEVYVAVLYVTENQRIIKNNIGRWSYLLRSQFTSPVANFTWTFDEQ